LGFSAGCDAVIAEGASQARGSSSLQPFSSSSRARWTLFRYGFG